MTAPVQIVIVPVPVGNGDRGAWKRSQADYRRHKAVRPGLWRPQRSIPERDSDRLRYLVEQIRHSHRQQTQTALSEGRRALADAMPQIKAALRR
jgi:hypothetical protein